MASVKPLSGIKVIELGTYVALPSCGRLLADYGAEVIKIETAGGDGWRLFGEGLVERTSEMENPLFDMFNAGKKDISINMKTPAGMEIMHKLLSEADIFITNTRAKSLKKLGLDYETLHEKYPRLIHGVINGYGDLGPDAEKPGFDTVAFWTRSGFMTDMLIMPKEGNPYPIGASTGVGDAITGMSLTVNLLAALRQRDLTGVGEATTVSLFNTALWFTGGLVVRAQDPYNDPLPKKRSQVNPFSTCYLCADGEWISVTIMDYEKYAGAFFAALGRPELRDDPRFCSNNLLRANSAEIIDDLEAAFLQKPSAEWLRIFAELDIVSEAMAHFKDIPNDQQAWANGYVQKYTCRNGEECVLTVPPLNLTSMEPVKAGVSPLIGEHTRSILTGLGYSQEEIRKMEADGAVKSHAKIQS